MPQQENNPPQSPTPRDDFAGLRCPKCDYDLTGLHREQCPECGEPVDAAALRDALLAGRKRHAHTQYAVLIAAFALVNLCAQIVVVVLISYERMVVDVAPIVARHMDRIAWIGMNGAMLGGGASVFLAMLTIIAAGIRANGKAMAIAGSAIVLSLLAAYLGVNNAFAIFW